MTPEQRRSLQEALIGAFPSWDALTAMFRQAVDEPLERISNRAQGLNSVVFQLVEWCEARNKTPRLVICALRQNPEYPPLREIARVLLQAEQATLRTLWTERSNYLRTLVERRDPNGQYTNMPHLHSILERIFAMASASSVNPFQFDGFHPSMVDDLIEMLTMMHGQIEGGGDLREVVALARDSKGQDYAQVYWSPATTTAAGMDLIQKLLDNALEQFPHGDKGQSAVIPVVVLAMKAGDAAQLANLEAFEGYPLEAQHAFQGLRQWLDSSQRTSDWLQRYGAKPEEWKPFGSSGNGRDVKQIVEQVFSDLNTEMGSDWKPRFEDVRALMSSTESLPQRRKRLSLLRSQAPLVIVDAISMYHPAVLRVLQQTSLESFPNTSVAAIAPNDDAFDEIRRQALVLRLQFAELELAARIDDESERFACQAVSKELDVRKWLRNRIDSRKLNTSPIFHEMIAVRGQV